uniref:Transposase (Putative), gypsy type n=1 Tax=Brassica oleracea var. oleracea TaxID=109376 RepID=A0A0D3ATM9_BRAOL
MSYSKLNKELDTTVQLMRDTSSGKKNSKRVAPRPSKSKNVGEDDEVLITPKEEFIPHSVDPEEAERYWVVVCNKITLPLETPFPRRLRFPVNPNSPSRIVPSYIDTILEFCHVPDEVEFRIPVPGERAEDPPEGLFTCYEVFLRCRLWFPIPEIIVRVMNHLEISISQLNPTGMQHLIGILVLSYKYGLTRVHEHFEALLKTLQSSEPFSYSLVPQPFMSIIRGHTSNSHSWRERGFFVRINSASVEESGIPIFLGNILPLFPEDMMATSNLLRSADPVEVVEEETDSDMGDAVPQDVPIGDGKRKGKGIDLDDIEFSADGFPLPGWDPGFVPGDGSITSEMPLPDCDFENLFSNLPPGFDSYKEARVFRFKAEEAERQLALLRSKASARNEQLAGDHAKSLRHAERKGMSNYAAMVGARASQFKAEYQQLKEA